MSRPIVCAGGYGVGIKGGRFQVTQIRATIQNPALFARLQLIDDETKNFTTDRWGTIYSSKSRTQKLLFDIKKPAGSGDDIDICFGDPLKVMNALSAIKTENIEPGSLFVYTP